MIAGMSRDDSAIPDPSDREITNDVCNRNLKLTCAREAKRSAGGER